MLLRTTSRLLRTLPTVTSTSTSSSRLPSTITSTRSYHATRVVASTAIVQHRDTKHNNADTPFEFTEESKKKIDWWLAKFPANYRQSAVMPLLVIAQEQNDNWIPLSAMNKIAQILDMPPIRVYEVATFYSMYNREPVGKYHIQLCGTTPCQLCGAETICETIEKHLHIKKGETTPDGLFTLTEVECLGACANAPMIQVNNHEFYENLTPETTIRLLENWKNGKPNKVGPQNGQRVAEGIMGKTTLKTETKPVTRDLDALIQQVKAEQEKAKAEAAAKAAAAASAPKA